MLKHLESYNKNIDNDIDKKIENVMAIYFFFGLST